jgi:hypothetical protein
MSMSEGCVSDDCTDSSGRCQSSSGFKWYDAFSSEGFQVNDCQPVEKGSCHSDILTECRFKYYRDLEDGGTPCDVKCCNDQDIGDPHCDNPQSDAPPLGLDLA